MLRCPGRCIGAGGRRAPGGLRTKDSCAGSPAWIPGASLSCRRPSAKAGLGCFEQPFGHRVGEDRTDPEPRLDSRLVYNRRRLCVGELVDRLVQGIEPVLVGPHGPGLSLVRSRAFAFGLAAAPRRLPAACRGSSEISCDVVASEDAGPSLSSRRCSRLSSRALSSSLSRASCSAPCVSVGSLSHQ